MLDRLTEWHGVHKVKTIGDAYVVCCGAFDEAPTAAEAARRVVGMGLSMLDEVELCKREHGVDIAIRVGVHTGPAIGGIIGTVRFHFDLWGAAIAGAASLEEQGAAAKVYVSSSYVIMSHEWLMINRRRREGPRLRRHRRIGGR